MRNEKCYRELKELSDEKIRFNDKVIDSLFDDDKVIDPYVRNVTLSSGGRKVQYNDKLKRENEDLKNQLYIKAKRLNFLESNRIGSINYYKNHYNELKEENKKLKEENRGMRNDIKNKTFKYPSKRGNESLRQEALGWQEKYLKVKSELEAKDKTIKIKTGVINDKERIINGMKDKIVELENDVREFREDNRDDWRCLYNERQFFEQERDEFNQQKDMRMYALNKLRDERDNLKKTNEKLANEVNRLLDLKEELREKNEVLKNKCNILRKESNNDDMFFDNLKCDSDFIRSYSEFVRNNYIEDPRVVILSDKVERLQNEIKRLR